MFGRTLRPALIAFVAIFAVPHDAWAYIGPGAGLALVGSSTAFIGGAVLALLSLLIFPVRFLRARARRERILKKSQARRVIILGYDGLDPKLTEKFIEAGKLPNLARLKEQGAYSRLGTTLPSLSPVAWSTFQTGVNPGAHNVFDFVTRDPNNYRAKLVSVEEIDQPRGFFSRLLGGRSGKVARLTRKSKPFWQLLAREGLECFILRVPISYPPEPFNGHILSAMCTPDLRGTQGTFTLYSTALPESEETISGEIRAFAKKDKRLSGVVQGPVAVPFTLEVDAASASALLLVDGQKIRLEQGKTSPWIEIGFPLSRRKKLYGIVRFSLRKISPEIELYISPVNVSPDHPALSISWPSLFSRWLARKVGLFGTLGFLEDTWARNEFALDDRTFLDQAYSNHNERRAMLFEALKMCTTGVCACVFDISDRVQHIFWRYLDPAHPAPKENVAAFEKVIEQMYIDLDTLTGEVQATLGADDILIVMSDHGFSSFRRCVNLNSWLQQHGYLVLKEGRALHGATFADVDWQKSRAYAVGITGIYINRIGRERFGCVPEAQVPALAKEISERLGQLADPADNRPPVARVYLASKEYRGLYAEQAPDLIVAYNEGYRVSWKSITGGFENDVISDNLKAWSGDHHRDPSQIPGVFFANRKLAAEAPSIIDLAPTVLSVFGVQPPAYCEGKKLF